MKSVKTCSKLLEVLDDTLQKYKDIPVIFIVCRDNYYDPMIHDEYRHLCLNSYFITDKGLSDDDIYTELDFEDVMDIETSVSELKDKINYEIIHRDQCVDDPVVFWEVYKFAYAKIYDFKSGFMDKALVMIIVEDNIAKFKNHINIVSHKLMQKLDAYLEMKNLEDYKGELKIENLQIQLENTRLEEEILKVKEETRKIKEEIRMLQEDNKVKDKPTEKLSLFDKFCYKITDIYLAFEEKYLDYKSKKKS